MAQLAGFELESRHADWQRGRFTADSGSHVSVYRFPIGEYSPSSGRRCDELTP